MNKSWCKLSVAVYGFENDGVRVIMLRRRQGRCGEKVVMVEEEEEEEANSANRHRNA